MIKGNNPKNKLGSKPSYNRLHYPCEVSKIGRFKSWPKLIKYILVVNVRISNAFWHWFTRNPKICNDNNKETKSLIFVHLFINLITSIHMYYSYVCKTILRQQLLFSTDVSLIISWWKVTVIKWMSRSA